VNLFVIVEKPRKDKATDTFLDKTIEEIKPFKSHHYLFVHNKSMEDLYKIYT
jgi:hypothetical protein